MWRAAARGSPLILLSHRRIGIIAKGNYFPLEQGETFSAIEVKAGIYCPGIQVQYLGNYLPAFGFEPADLVYIRCDFDGAAARAFVLAGKYIQ